MLHNTDIEVVVFIDFDGTLTGRNGGTTVSDPFYKSLYENPALVFDSPDACMKDATTLNNALKEMFGKHESDYTKQNSDLLITKNAVDFLHAMLRNPKVTVNIISQNRKEYILALLRYHGFSHEEINELTIKPLTSRSKPDKVTDICIAQSLMNKKPIVYLFDDSQDELNNMSTVIQLVGATEHAIHSHHHAPGNFPWETYAIDIEFYTNPLMNELKHETEAKRITSDGLNIASEEDLRDFIDDCLTYDLNKIKNEPTQKQLRKYLLTIKNMKNIPQENIASLILLAHRLLFKALMPQHANNQKGRVNLVMSEKLKDDLFPITMRIDPRVENVWKDRELFFTRQDNGKILKAVSTIMTPKTSVSPPKYTK